MIQTQQHGTDHLSVASTLHNLGNCYRDLCDFAKSHECLLKSLHISTMNYEEDNEEVADTLHCLGMTLMSTCELDDAISYLERAFSSEVWSQRHAWGFREQPTFRISSVEG